MRRTDLDDVAVEDGRSYIVTADDDLLFFTGDTEVARFAAATWIAVRHVGVPLREVWPPDDFDRLMSDLGERLVVGYGLDFRYPLEPFLDPFFNDLNAFVDAVVEREGCTPAQDSEERRWIARSVAQVFGIEDRPDAGP